ncbi:impB/mucB/samB family C-terminal domain [Methylobacterium sp. ap11]|nr:impB/mucB/samB family C-terminal domain [Methylobacterium sp. ap11]
MSGALGQASLLRLEAMAFDTVADLRHFDPWPARASLTVVGARINHKLRGRAGLLLDIVPARRKGCAVTRSFSRRINERIVLEQAVAAHAIRLGKRLRRDGLAVSAVAVFEHDRGNPMRSVSTVVHQPEATNDTRHLIQAALHGVAKTWKEQGPTPWRYSKAGLVMKDPVPLKEAPRPLFGALDQEKFGVLMSAIDVCNSQFGLGAVVPARAG